MLTSRVLCSLALLGCAACTPLLDADFDSLPEGTLNDEVVSLPGAPDGDRMIIHNHAQIADTTDSGDRTLLIFRNPFINETGNHSEAYFDPIAASGGESLFFSWTGTIIHTPTAGSDSPVVALKLRDLVDGDQPNLFSKLTIRFGPGKITAALPAGDEVSIGNGVTGSHKVVLRIDPGPKTYAFFVGGDGVSPGSGFTHNGSLAPDTTIDPNNIGFTITFADEINAGATTYIVNNALVSVWEP
ncbi:MAG: hypothetical protein ACFCUQ_21210 [Kiloniellales bacterium]